VCVLALQAAVQDLDGSGLVVSGAQVVQARRGRASDCGAAAQKRFARGRLRSGELRARRRLGVVSRRRVSGGGTVYGRGCRRRFREEEEKQE